MSGLEIAGVVLGAIPVSASALREIERTADKAKRFVRWRLKLPLYVEELEKEGVALGLILRRLCRTVGEDLDLSAFALRDSAHLWPSDELTQKLQVRHRRVFDIIEKSLLDIGGHVDELCKELGLGAPTEVSHVLAFCSKHVPPSPSRALMLCSKRFL